MLLESLYFKPIFKVEHAELITDSSYPNADALIKDPSGLGLLEEITGQKRNQAFSYTPYLDVFRDSWQELEYKDKFARRRKPHALFGYCQWLSGKILNFRPDYCLRRSKRLNLSYKSPKICDLISFQ